jgi:hypothetical protein
MGAFLEGEDGGSWLGAAPVPSLGAVATAPVVLLLARPDVDATMRTDAYRFAREGWPLAALHPDAPSWLGTLWDRRLASLCHRFGAQHVSNAVAAIFLDPWPDGGVPAGVAAPSRQRAKALAERAAARDAAFVVVNADDWLAHAPIAALPPSRRWRVDATALEDLDGLALGAEAWDVLCARIAVHAWL